MGKYLNGCIRLNFQLKTVLLKDSKSNIDYVKMGFIIASIVLQVWYFENFKDLKINYFLDCQYELPCLSWRQRQHLGAHQEKENVSD